MVKYEKRETFSIWVDDIIGVGLADEGVTPLVLVAEICESCQVKIFGR